MRSPSPRGACRSPASGFPLRRSRARDTARYRDSTARRSRSRAEGWLARIFQHEYDHLDGILYADRLEHEHTKAVAKALQKRAGVCRARAGRPASTTSKASCNAQTPPGREAEGDVACWCDYLAPGPAACRCWRAAPRDERGTPSRRCRPARSARRGSTRRCARRCPTGRSRAWPHAPQRAMRRRRPPTANAMISTTMTSQITGPMMKSGKKNAPPWNAVAAAASECNTMNSFASEVRDEPSASSFVRACAARICPADADGYSPGSRFCGALLRTRGQIQPAFTSPVS